MTITLEAIRAAGGIVHSDGNIFFRDISMLQGLAGAAPAAVAPRGEEWRRPTTYLKRFGDAIALLCHGRRPEDQVLASWLDGTSDVLQQFAVDNGPAWAQGIGLIDAATIAADQPTEGVAHEMRAATAPALEAPQGEYPHEQMDAMALARYKVVPSHASMLWSHAVVAGDGAQQLYVGREVECQNMARKFAGAFLDGAFAFHSMAAAPTAPQAPAQEAPAAPAVPAGFALVPIEPTQQMLDAGRWSGAGSVSIQEEWARKEVWSRMLATVTPPPAAYADDLVALVTELVQALRKATPDNDLAGHALDYLKRNGLQESPLRAADTAPQAPAAPALSAAPIPVMPRAITAGLGLDDSGEEPAYCVMVAFRQEDDARYALSILSAGLGATAAPAAGNWIAAEEVDRLVRDLDVALHGEADAAPQASLCDIVGLAKAAAGKLGRPVLAAPAAPSDPMDWPLPCDVTVGHGTIRKGCKLRTLVLRMQVLYDLSQKVELAAPAAPAVDADPMAEFLRDTGPAIVWPKARDVGRIGDMSPSAHLRIGLDSDNDVYASIWDERGGATIEFCTPGQGGGKSSRTRMALLAVMVAMEADNAADPGRDWWAERNGAAQAAAKGTAS